MDMLGFDYFKLLDLLTIARSRKHIEKYYGTQETGKFPERLPPINIKSDVDRAGEFRSIREINDEIRRLNLGAYAPLRYVLPHKQAAYDEKYSTRCEVAQGLFRQARPRGKPDSPAARQHPEADGKRRHLLRPHDQASACRRGSACSPGSMPTTAAVEEMSIEDIEVDDPAFETLLDRARGQGAAAGRGPRALAAGPDRRPQPPRHACCRPRGRSIPARDDKLDRLRELIQNKVRNPINPGNRKIIVFTAFADTAEYLYRELARLGAIESRLAQRAGHRRRPQQDHAARVARRPRRRSSQRSRRAAKERPAELADEGEIDLLIATDCISEGQNLQDCDSLINYDIHWNPVRIIQRFGRIDRIGSPNERIQLVNFWPNMELGGVHQPRTAGQRPHGLARHLRHRRREPHRAAVRQSDERPGVPPQAAQQVAGRRHRSGRPEQRRLHRRPDAERLPNRSGGLPARPSGASGAIAARHLRRHDDPGDGEAAIAPGVIFCLRAVGEAALKSIEPGYPLAPHYLVHVGEDGTVLLPYTQAKQVLDRLKKLCIGRDLPDATACARFDKATRNGEEMAAVQKQLAAAVAAITGKKEERAVASLSLPAARTR